MNCLTSIKDKTLKALKKSSAPNSRSPLMYWSYCAKKGCCFWCLGNCENLRNRIDPQPQFVFVLLCCGKIWSGLVFLYWNSFRSRAAAVPTHFKWKTSKQHRTYWAKKNIKRSKATRHLLAAKAVKDFPWSQRSSDNWNWNKPKLDHLMSVCS